MAMDTRKPTENKNGITKDPSTAKGTEWNMVGKRKLKEIQEKQQSKNETSHMMIENTEEKDTRINQTDRELMNFRGQQAVEADTDKDTPVQV